VPNRQASIDSYVRCVIPETRVRNAQEREALSHCYARAVWPAIYERPSWILKCLQSNICRYPWLCIRIGICDLVGRIYAVQ